MAYPLLTESAGGDGDGLTDRCPEFASQLLEHLMGVAIDTNTGTRHVFQHTILHA